VSTYLTTQLHPQYSQKISIWEQISRSYSGGQTYRDGEYLHKFSLRESDTSYTERQKRAVYMNHVQPLADMLTGFLYSTEPERRNVTLEYLWEKTSKTLDLPNFMRNIALNSLLYTCGVLVDSPKFNKSDVPTEGARQAAGKNPYCIMYMPWQIRNFYHDENGKLSWVLLDNSLFNNSDPHAENSINLSYRLWTTTYYQDYTSSSSIDQNTQYGVLYGTGNMSDSFQAGEKVPYDCGGEIPFVFANWSDRLNTYFTDTIFDDIAFFDQAIYNYMSLMDEMLSGGVFKFLFYPGTVPDAVKTGGFSNMAVITMPPDGNAPFFAGPSLGDIDPFLQAINFYIVGIKRLLGIDTDQEKSYAQSGEAKKYDYTKVKAILNVGARAMERVEREIFRYAGQWEGKEEVIDVEYRKDFLGDEEENELTRMFEVINLPYEKMKKAAARRIATINFSDNVDDKELKEMFDDIDNTNEQEPITDINAMMELEKTGRGAPGENKPEEVSDDKKTE
jgi:hypothetical protein